MNSRTLRDATKKYRRGSWYVTKRLLPLLLVIIITTFIFGDVTQLVMTMWSASRIALVGIIWHFFRKRMWWYADLNKLVLKACEEPIGAAIVFMSITFTLIAFIRCAIQ